MVFLIENRVSVGQFIISLAVFIKINYENFLPIMCDHHHHHCFFTAICRKSCKKIFMKPGTPKATRYSHGPYTYVGGSGTYCKI